jgi:hypothetical protein
MSSEQRSTQAYRPRTPRGHFHAEAFCLMWYACEGETRMERIGNSVRYERCIVKPPCGHREQYWNSRDGVTPFGTSCPSCGGSLLHTDFNLDRYAPEHKPHRGQRLWVDMTRERAEFLARKRIEAARAAGHDVDDARLPSLIENFFNEGQAPDLVVSGYCEVT